jgi:ribose/xylose/arabinose/galactoside ABC-type transport system permease subunit
MTPTTPTPALTGSGDVPETRQPASRLRTAMQIAHDTGLTQRLGLIVALILLCVVASILAPNFLSQGNATNVARALALYGIVSVGQTFVIIVGGIDLSVGSVAAIAGVVLVEVQGVGFVPGVILALCAGAAVGAFHGVVTVRTGINSLITTLATMTALRGVTYVATNGFPLPLDSQWAPDNLWKNIGGFLPVPFIVFIAFLVIGHLLLRWTRTGTAIYATGGNRRAAREAGINVSRSVILAFVISGVCAAVAGVLLVARFGSAAADAGTGWELISIAAVVIGGTSLTGGRGDLLGTLLGVLLLGVIDNAMDLKGINSFYQQIVQGMLILVAVGASTYRQRNEQHNDE